MTIECFGTFGRIGMNLLYGVSVLDCSMNNEKEEILKTMPKWFLKLREVYWKKYNEDLYDLLDDLARMADD